MRSSPRRDALIVAAVAAAARAGVVLWGAPRFPPTADGSFYHTIATRIAQGHGYTWLWPDGVVTYAAHYPVGYPALMGAAYWLLGSHPASAMIVNALLGVAGASATYALAERATSRRAALVVGLIAALHVGLVAYTPALMTEGVTAALWVAGAWSALRAREAAGRRALWWLLATSAILAAATMVRPQSLVMAPWFGWWALAPSATWTARLRRALALTAISALLCAPWAVRNKVRMGEAGLSFNGGWNLLIGATPSARGSWAPLEVPDACREVFDEAKKDSCFGREALRWIAHNPIRWAVLAPEKLAVTFDYCGAAGWYLNASNGQSLTYDAKIALGVVETGMERLVLGAALVGLGAAKGPRRRGRLVVAALAVLPLLTRHAWVSYLAPAVLAALFGGSLASMPFVLPASAGVLALTALTHAVFFGAGRYSLPVMPFITALAGGFLRRAPDSVEHPRNID